MMYKTSFTYHHFYNFLSAYHNVIFDSSVKHHPHQGSKLISEDKQIMYGELIGLGHNLKRLWKDKTTASNSFSKGQLNFSNIFNVTKYNMQNKADSRMTSTIQDITSDK